MLSTQAIKRLIDAGALRVKPSSGNIRYKMDDEWIPADIIQPKDNRAPDCPYEHRPFSISAAIYVSKYLKGYTQNMVNIAKVVWISVNGVYPSGYYVMHRDGNAWNNRIDNLILVPRKKQKVVYHLFYIEIWKWWDKVDWCHHETWKDPPSPDWFQQLDKYQLTQEQWGKLLKVDLMEKVKSKKNVKKNYRKKKTVDLDFD